MHLKLIPGANREAALQGLETASSRLSSTAPNPHAYITWVLDLTRYLRNWFTSSTVQDIILTERYRAIQGAASASFATDVPPVLQLLLRAEMEDQRRRLLEAMDGLKALIAAWDFSEGTLILPDTNVYIQHKCKFDEIQWAAMCDAEPWSSTVLVIPSVVLRELDSLKKGRDTRWRAAYTLACIEAAYGGQEGLPRCAPLVSKGVKIRVVLDEIGSVPLASADDEIVAQALWVQAASGRQVRIVTFDTAMAFQARQAGLTAIRLGAVDRPDGWKVESH